MVQKKTPAKGVGSGSKSSGTSSGGRVKAKATWGKHPIKPNPPGSGIKSRHGRGRGGKPNQGVQQS